MGLVAPDLYVVVPGVGLLAALQTSVSYPLIWPAAGRIVQVSAFPEGDGSAAGMASLGFSVTVEGGASQGFTSYGGSSSTGDAFLLFAAIPNALSILAGLTTGFHNRPVRQNEKWSIKFHNSHGANAYLPNLTFGLKRD